MCVCARARNQVQHPNFQVDYSCLVTNIVGVLQATSTVATGIGGGSARGALAPDVNPRYEQQYMDAMKSLNSGSTKKVVFAGA